MYKKYTSNTPKNVINILEKENIPKKWLIPSTKIIHYLSEMPWYTQENLIVDTGLPKEELIKLNKLIISFNIISWNVLHVLLWFLW